MIKKSLIGILFPFMLLSFPREESTPLSNSAEESFTQCGVTNTTFGAGEEITFELSYKWGVINMNAGKVVFKVEDMGDTYRFSAFGRTYS